ncbi:hypothetical protein C7C46_09025 [Streptomyces tateyamensis]|uniref:Holin n=1 Tax=Streptomyces tateyamensis TaxID=565073 RepID=A0A2V4P1L8_9ACTN|nr:hypothetical protein [Streptomyces tateyamensis]PYC83464.1 hypothetical protein C7C46_09025 [Streptomyces tateyamensis]
MANAPIETKVRWSSAAALVLGLIITGLNSGAENSALLAPLPQWAQSIITLMGPPLAVLLAGWAAPHSPRPAPDPAAPAAPAAVSVPTVPPAVTDPGSGA